MLMTKEAISGINTNTDKMIMDGKIKRYALFWFCAAYFLFLFVRMAIITPYIANAMWQKEPPKTTVLPVSFSMSIYCASTLSIASDASLKASPGVAAPVITFSNSGIMTSLSIWLASA